MSYTETPDSPSEPIIHMQPGIPGLCHAPGTWRSPTYVRASSPDNLLLIKLTLRRPTQKDNHQDVTSLQEETEDPTLQGK